MNNEIETNKIQQLNNLYSFLDKYRINKTDKTIKPSHISMDKYMGSFNIPEDKLMHFFKFYQKAVKVGNIPSILESHLEQGPLIIDLDFKYTPTTNTRAYSDKDIMNILKIYNQVILTYLSINEDDLNIYILEKDEPKKVDEITYKDGLHIIYPFICVNNKIQLFFRELVISKIIEDKILDHLNLINGIDDVFDKAVIERNNWLLYGSGKNDNPLQLYKLTKIYDYNFNLLDLYEVNWFNLPLLLSIRKYKAENHSEYVSGYNLDKINNLYMDLMSQKTNTKPYALTTDIQKAKVLCSMLSGKRAKEYLTWIEVGFCLHNIDEALLEDWIEFSKKSPGFKVGECDKCWAKFKYEGLNIGSLYRWAKDDNPKAYSDYLISELDNILKDNIKNSSYAVARVFYELNKYNYVCCSISKKKWFEYVNHRWEPMDEANSIIGKLNIELTNDYIKMGIAYGQKAIHTENEHIKKDLLAKSKISYTIAEKLGSMVFKKEVIKELMHLYYDAKFMSKLDENRYLLGFNNGVYDLKNNYFRNGRSEDYISMSTRCDYIEFDKSNEQIINVYNFFNKIQKKKEMREYLLLKLSSFLEGVQRDQKFEIWTGTGANGKGRILKLIIDALGDYACTIPITLLTKPRSDSNSASPALATTKGKRCCVFQEPENDDKIYVGHMKNITGGDKLMARSLYSDPVEFYPQFKTILACNKLPEIPSADGGTWRRIRVVPFETKFVDNPTEENHEQKINNIDDLIDDWKSAFLSILIENYKIYIRDGINEPEQVLLHTKEYEKNSDLYIEYITEHLIQTSHKDYLTTEETWNDFRKWLGSSNRYQQKKIKKLEAKTELELRLGKIISDKYYGYRFKTNIDNDNITNTEMLNSSFDLSTVQQSNNLDNDINENEDPIDKLFIKTKS